jgi:hypothetical protein
LKSRTFPKENQKKLNETIRDLKALLRQRDREISFLRRELENLVKPVRDRKPHIDRSKLELEEWRKDFIRRWRKEVQGKE